MASVRVKADQRHRGSEGDAVAIDRRGGRAGRICCVDQIPMPAVGHHAGRASNFDRNRPAAEMGPRSQRPMGPRVHGLIAAWAREHMGPGAHGPWSFRAQGPLGRGALGLMGPRPRGAGAHGPQGLGVLGLMGPRGPWGPSSGASGPVGPGARAAGPEPMGHGSSPVGATSISGVGRNC